MGGIRSMGDLSVELLLVGMFNGMVLFLLIEMVIDGILEVWFMFGCFVIVFVVLMEDRNGVFVDVY